MKSLRLIIIIFLFLSIFIVINADVIIHKDGKRIEGTIVSITPEQVAIDISGIIIFINTADIKEIIREKKPEIVLAAESALENENYELALAKSVEILLSAPEFTELAKKVFFGSLQKLKDRSAEFLKKGDFDQAIRLYLFLLKQIENEYVRSLFFEDPESWSLFLRKEIKDNLSQAYYQRGQKYLKLKQAEFYPIAKTDLLEAAKLLPEGSPLYYELKLSLARLSFELGEYEEAKKYLEIVIKEAPSMEQREQATLLLSRLFPRVTLPAAVPTPTPIPRAVLTPLPKAPPATQPPPVISYEKLPALKKFLMKNPKLQKILTPAVNILQRIKEGEYLPYLLYPLIIIFLWMLSYKYLKTKARHGDIIAASLLNLSRKIGPFAVVYFHIKQKKVGAPKRRCPFCGKGIDDIEAYTDLNFYICPHCQENITPVFDLTDYIEHLVKNVEKSLHSRAKRGVTIGTDGMPIEKDAMLKLLRSLITYAVRRRASDLHIEQEIDRVKVRARIDGILFDIFNFPKSIANAVVSAIKVMANLDIAEKRIPQDGQFTMWIDKADIDIRVASSPAAMGEKVSLRLLDLRNVMVDATKLGLDGTNLEKFQRSIRKPHGLILVTGPSGSGKTTTLYVALNAINTGETNIITIEDPIEYHIKGLNQLQVNPAANFTFATGLRSIVRQDPDVILVGEIRDRETADIGVEAALTGHLVFSTLHTIDAAGAFGRLVDLGVDPKRFVPALICIIAQRLIRLNCPECRKPYKPKKSDLELLGISTEEAKEITFMKGSGCPYCFNSGFFGRIGLFEILMPDEAMKEILETNVATSVIRELARKSGMHTLREEGILKVKQGLTNVEEVIRVTS